MGVLNSVDFDRFVSSMFAHFHCNAMRVSNKACMNWHKIQQIQHAPAHQILAQINLMILGRKHP